MIDYNSLKLSLLLSAWEILSQYDDDQIEKMGFVICCAMGTQEMYFSLNLQKNVWLEKGQKAKMNLPTFPMFLLVENQIFGFSL